jgi:DNA-binding transcriptional LysR family regulator
MKERLRDIEYFSVVAEHGHLGRAADALGLSQPALSKSLRRLEQAMQAKLVRRTSKGVELTTVGAALFSHVRRLRLSLDDVTREVADLAQGRAGHLRIGCAPIFSTYVLPAACAALLKEAPGLTFKVTFLDLEIAVPALRHGELDFYLAPFQASRHEDLVEEHLFDQEVVAYASTRHRLARKKKVELADLARERWAVAALNAPSPPRLRQAFLDAGLPPPEIAMESNSLMFRHRIVASTDLVGIAPKQSISESFPRSRCVVFRVRDLNYIRRVGMMYREDAYLSPAARRFIEILKATAKEIAKENR